MRREMRKTINGQPAEWTPEIEAAWLSVGVPHAASSNWFTARPYQDQYSRGSEREGFVYTARKEDGRGEVGVYCVEKIVPKPTERYINPRARWQSGPTKED